MRSLVLLCIVNMFFVAVQGIGIAKEKHCPCRNTNKLTGIPPNADCLWLHRLGSPCGDEAVAHFPPTFLRNGKPQTPLCLDYAFVNRTIPNGEGIYCVIRHVNNTREYVPNCEYCNKRKLLRAGST
ncbi:truncated Rh161 [macacine betaherpesvirus 3]|nr:truncated Rh161 [macacine betaherpesvirus 3]